VGQKRQCLLDNLLALADRSLLVSCKEPANFVNERVMMRGMRAPDWCLLIEKPLDAASDSGVAIAFSLLEAENALEQHGDIWLRIRFSHHAPCHPVSVLPSEAISSVYVKPKLDLVKIFLYSRFSAIRL
jgi:hypothetical protein